MENVVYRNNTSFPKQLMEAMKAINVKDDKNGLRYHQKLVVDYLIKYPYARGILAYHKMGAGKSILGISICEELIRINPSRKVLFIASKSLHTNMTATIAKYRKMVDSPTPPDDLEAYQFISLNASNMINQVYRAVSNEVVDEAEKLYQDRNPNKDAAPEDEEELKDFAEKLKIHGNLDDKIIMVDEAHNFFNSITNGSKNAIGLYKMIMEAKNIKVIFLTGSPIVNDPFEIAVAFNMISGPMGAYVSNTPGVDGVDETEDLEKKPEKTKKKSKSITAGLTLFGEDFDDFHSYFVLEKGGIKNREKFMHRIVGLVSYFGADSKADMAMYPTQLPTVVRRVSMSARQYTLYIEARDREIDEANRPSKFSANKKPLTKPEGRSSSYRVRSRQFSNFVYPEYASKSYRDANNVIHYEKNIADLKPSSLVDAELAECSQKLLQLIVDLERHTPYKFISKTEKSLAKGDPVPNPGIGPGIIYSQFKDSGVDLLAKILQAHGFKEMVGDTLTPSPSSSNGTYAIISGEVDILDRQKIVDIFSSPENIKGEILTTLLVTSTGAEGIDLKNGRYVMVMEPYWHWSRISQIFARVVRMMSHYALPLKDRVVQPYIYLSDYPTSSEYKKLEKGAKSKEELAEMKKKKERELTTDVQLYTESIRNQIIINTFRRAMEEASIDCHMHYGPKSDKKLNCIMCAPTNRQLFANNLDVDIREPSRCEPIVEEKIVANSITLSIDGQDYEYMWTSTNGEPHIFTQDKTLNAYREIGGEHPHYYAILEEINNNKSKTSKKKTKK